MPAGSIELVSMSEYARRRGCTEAAVRRAVRDGRISLMDGRVDPVAADAQWARNTRVRAGSRPADDVNLRAPGAAPPAAGGNEPPVEDYYLVKARRERAEADIAELKLAELRGDLVRLADVEAVHSRLASQFRDSMLQMRTRLAPVLAACNGDEAKIGRILEEEHHKALLQFSGASDGRS
jgi:hypothetical protein